MGTTLGAYIQTRPHGLKTLQKVDCVHILVVLIAQVKAGVRPGVRISKPVVHYNVFSGKAVAGQGFAPKQASPLVLTLSAAG